MSGHGTHSDNAMSCGFGYAAISRLERISLSARGAIGFALRTSHRLSALSQEAESGLYDTPEFVRFNRHAVHCLSRGCVPIR